MEVDVPPNQTIYVNNLYEKLHKEELKKCLYAMFSQFGKILDVVCLKTHKLRGQAWVVFGDVTAATNALRSMQGFPFFEKPIRIAYAKTKSDAVAKLDGTYTEKAKKARKAAAPAPAGKKATATAAAVPVSAPTGGDDTAPPNRILFVQNLPEATTGKMLEMLFSQFPGFMEVRMVDGRTGIAFIEFQTDTNSATAMAGLQGFKILPSHPMHITYAKA